MSNELFSSFSDLSCSSSSKAQPKTSSQFLLIFWFVTISNRSKFVSDISGLILGVHTTNSLKYVVYRVEILKKIHNTYLKKRCKDIKNTWSRLFFGTPEKFVTLLDYKNEVGKIKPELKGSNIHRISREYTDNIIQGLKEMQFVSDHLNTSYKQEILDSNEFHMFLEDLLEVGENSRHTDIDTYPTASKLFNMSLGILLQKAPIEIQDELKESVKRFIKFNNLAIKLGYPKLTPLETPRFLE